MPRGFHKNYLVYSPLATSCIVNAVILALQMKMQKLREVNSLTLDHTANKCQNLKSNPDLLISSWIFCHLPARPKPFHTTWSIPQGLG